jgi:hypothetical protein
MYKIHKKVKFDIVFIPFCEADRALIVVNTTCDKRISPKCLQCPHVNYVMHKVPKGAIGKSIIREMPETKV